MTKVVITRAESFYTFKVECDFSEVPAALKRLEEVAAQVKETIKTTSDQRTLIEQIPSVAGANTATDAVIMLLKSPWATEPRDMKAIAEALIANGRKVPTSTLSGILFHLIKTGRIRRWKSGSSYVYYRVNDAHSAQESRGESSVKADVD